MAVVYLRVTVKKKFLFTFDSKNLVRACFMTRMGEPARKYFLSLLRSPSVLSKCTFPSLKVFEKIILMIFDAKMVPCRDTLIIFISTGL